MKYKETLQLIITQLKNFQCILHIATFSPKEVFIFNITIIQLIKKRFEDRE